VPIALYKCSKCGRVFKTEEEAAACEASHVDVIGIWILDYTFYCPYPRAIKAVFADGHEDVYVLEREAEQMMGTTVILRKDYGGHENGNGNLD
jgi:hypothetical protein